MDPQQITKLANLLRDNGDKLLNNGFSFQLTGSLLRALNDSFTLIMESATDVPRSGQPFLVLKPNNFKSPVYRDLQLIFDFVQKTTLLCIAHKVGEEYDGIIDISKFRALKRLEMQKVPVRQVVGIQPLRSQLQEVICVKSLGHVEEIITRCGGDNSNGFVWNELKTADFSYNNLQTIDTSLEFCQYLQNLNLRHNKLISVEAIKWLPQLKTLDLSFNCLQYVPLLHVEACKRLQSLNISNNFVEDLTGLSNLSAITDLDLSDNCLLKHTSLQPLSNLLTLTYLNLSENPLCCHMKHRQTTAEYLHKNCATVKFILDAEPLTKSEKAAMGKHSVDRTSTRSCNIAIASTTCQAQTPTSSVGSTFSYTEAETATVTPDLLTNKKQRSKQRIVEINNIDYVEHEESVANQDGPKSNERVDETQSIVNNSTNNIEQHSSEWLQSTNDEMMKSILDSSPMSQDGRILLNEYLGEFSQSYNNTTMASDNVTVCNEVTLTSTPTNDSPLAISKPVIEEIISPIKVNLNDRQRNESTNISDTRDTVDQTYYTAEDNSEVINEELDDKYVDIFTSTAEEEPQESDIEEDEETYIVYASNNSKDPIFLTLSSNYLREKDTTEITKTKWSLKMLESSERLTADTLRLNFDTMVTDKRTRVYKVEDGMCQELQNKLRGILSQRNFSEMNQTIYRCVKCDSKFVAVLSLSDINCPNCQSTFVTEDLSEQSLPKSSPIAAVQALAINALPFTVQQISVDTNSIGSANSLNESSSCSKITNSQSSFDSNQSVVGSSNTDRDNFAANCESDVDILSNPSQSSIEVLEGSQYSQQHRKTSTEERSPEEIDEANTKAATSATINTIKESTEINKTNYVHLTESSSSGSVTDSICTTYEQTEKKKNKSNATDPSTQLIAAENGSGSSNKANVIEDLQSKSLSTVIGTIFQSTNQLMTGTKAFFETESSSGVRNDSTSKLTKGNKTPEQELACSPYKFNYSDFNDIDHRIKLYFLQHKFQQENDEKFKWVVRGRIYNENTNVLYDGVVVLSTCRMYLMEAYAPEHEDVTQWLRIVDNVPVNRLECIQLLPWKIGLAFTLRSWGGFLLLLQDILRTDSLLLHFANNALPSECEMKYQIAPQVQKRLNAVIGGEQLTMCSLLTACDVTCLNAKRTLKICALLTTDCHLYVTSENLSWLSLQTNPNIEPDVQVCVTQAMDNLVEVVRNTAQAFTIKYVDETHNIEELWMCTFETTENAESCLNAIGQTWEQLFGVPLCTGNV